jgi:hypothetical protein
MKGYLVKPDFIYRGPKLILMPIGPSVQGRVPPNLKHWALHILKRDEDTITG